MNTSQAERILDQVRDGADYSRFAVTHALFLVGEIDEHEFERMARRMRSAGMDGPLQTESRNTRCSGGAGLVGGNLSGNRAETGQGRAVGIEAEDE